MEITRRFKESIGGLNVKFKIRINPTGLSDVLEIKEYIARDNPGAAMKVVSAIYSKIEKLTDFPNMGIPLNSKVAIKTDYRVLICGVYLIFYKVEGEFISVYRVLNGTRDYLSILFSEETSKKQIKNKIERL